MIYRIVRTVLKQKKDPGLYEYLNHHMHLSNNLYNATLFRIRQNFTSRKKEHLTENEREVRREIEVIDQEESYTSKADLTAGDYIQTYGVDDEKADFSGTRIERGLYRNKDGIVFNADLIGAGNILRKKFPEIFSKVTDFSFLQDMKVIQVFS